MTGSAGTCGFGEWGTDRCGLPEFRVDVGTCPTEAWHLVGSPGLLALAHASGRISLFATAGGMVRLADRSGTLRVDGVKVEPTGVTFGTDRCTWVFEHRGAHVERSIASHPDRAELEFRWTAASDHPVTLSDEWTIDALPLIAAPLMSRRVPPPSTHRGLDRLVWLALFTVSDTARRITDAVRRLAGRRHRLRRHVEAGGRRIRWAPDGQRRPRRPRWFLAVPPGIDLIVDPLPEGARLTGHDGGLSFTVEAGGPITMTARLVLDDPLLAAFAAEQTTRDKVHPEADDPPVIAVNDTADVLGREAVWHLHQLRALRVPDPYIGRTFVMQGSAYAFVHGLHGAVRDEAFVVAALARIDPRTARDALVAMASMATPDGTFHYAHTGYGAVASGEVHSSPTDLPLFFLWAATSYVAATGDHHVLDVTVQPRGRSCGGCRGGTTTTVAAVASAAVHALDTRVGRGPHGMLRIGSGDWADPISLMVRHRRALRRDGESTFNTAMALAVLPAAAELLDGFDRGGAARCRTLVTELDAALESAWNGRWYLRGWDGRGGAIGDSHCFLDAQVWAVIAGHGPSERRAELVATMGRLLDDPSPIGPTILDRPHRVRLGLLSDGWDCNGGVWAALGGLAVWAFALHDPHRAHACLLRQTFDNRRRVYPGIWYGQWSGPDAANSTMGDRPGETYVHPATPMTEFPTMNSNVHAGPLLGLWALSDRTHPD